MMKKKGLLAIFLVLCLLAAGCGKTDIEKESAASDTKTSVPAPTDVQGSEASDPESLSDGQSGLGGF